MNRKPLVWLLITIWVCSMLTGCEDTQTGSNHTDKSSSSTSSTATSSSTTIQTSEFVDDFWVTYTGGDRYQPSYPDDYNPLANEQDEQYWATYPYPDGYDSNGYGDGSYTGGGTTVSSNVEEINVLDHGVDNTGKKDMTDKLTELHATGKRIYYPNGTYLFNGETLDLSGGVRFQSLKGVTVRNSISNVNILNFDDKGNLIGLMQNHLEYKVSGKNDMDFVKTGSLVSPPLSTANYSTKVDVLPFWYNDFGLHTRLVSSSGGVVWYDWRWNHHDAGNTAGNDPYDPALHPLLGYYFGDDATVLDWQCYWLREYGIDQAALVADNVNSDPASGSYWVYQLLNHARNAQKMDFAMWLPNRGYSETYDRYKAGWWKTFNAFYFNEQYKDQVYCYIENGKRYAVVWHWDERAIRFSLDQSSQKNMPNTIKLYKEVAQAFQDNGYDGVCFMARYGCMPETKLSELSKAGVKWFKISYSKRYGGATSYSDNVNKFTTSDDVNELYEVSTGLNTHTPHPSGWTCAGTTPALFGSWLKKAVNATVSDSNRAKIVTCYNVSEWAEGGPGLVPTVGNRFGYLDAIYKAIVK